MKTTLERRARQKRSLINLSGALLLIAAAALLGLMLFQNTPELQAWYGEYQEQLQALELKVLELHSISVWLLIAAVLFLYAFKSIVSLYPISFLCLLTGAISFSVGLSFAVNVLGIVILVSLRYFWGRRRGGGGLQRLLSLNGDIRVFLEQDGKAKSLMLFIFRVTPSFPVNAVSQIYGGMGYDYVDYTLISLLGFLPKLVSYIIIGSNWQNPLSNAFLIPLIIAFTLTGLSLISINLALAKRQDD